MQKKVFAPILLAAVLWITCNAARAQDNNPKVVDYLHTVVAESVITFQDIEYAARPGDQVLYEQYMSKSQVAGNSQEEFDRERRKIRQSILTNFIDYRVVQHEFKNLQKKNPEIKVPETYIDEQIRLEIREKFADDRVAFAKDLRNRGKTLEKYREEMRADWINVVMRSQFVKDPIISPRKIENYYVQNKDKYKLEDQVKFRLIVLNRPISDTEGQTRKRAEEILSQIKGGAQFAEMAKSYSEGSQRSDGGLTDWQKISIINKDLLPELEKLKPGQDSGVIETADACFILRLEDRRAAHARPLGDVRDEIEHELVLLEREHALEKWLGRLRAKTYVQTFAQ